MAFMVALMAVSKIEFRMCDTFQVSGRFLCPFPTDQCDEVCEHLLYARNGIMLD